MAERCEIDYLVVGHVCLDLVGGDGREGAPEDGAGRARSSSPVLGGTATYAALTARKLDQRVGVVTSADFDPRIIDTLVGRDNFRVAATDVRVARLPAEATTCFVNTYERSGRRQQIRALAEPLRAAHVPPEWRSAPTVHLAPVALDVAIDLVPAFPGALLGVTPQGWMRAWDEQGHVRAAPWEAAELVLGHADAVIFSVEDVTDPRLVLRYAEQARLLVVTEHRRGAVVYERGGPPRRSPAFRSAREVDPTGAGDVFAAAFLTHYRRTGDALASADYANCAASFAVEKRAWQGIPTREQVEERLRRGKRRGG